MSPVITSQNYYTKQLMQGIFIKTDNRATLINFIHPSMKAEIGCTATVGSIKWLLHVQDARLDDTGHNLPLMENS